MCCEVLFKWEISCGNLNNPFCLLKTQIFCSCQLFRQGSSRISGHHLPDEVQVGKYLAAVVAGKQSCWSHRLQQGTKGVVSVVTGFAAQQKAAAIFTCVVST